MNTVKRLIKVSLVTLGMLLLAAPLAQPAVAQQETETYGMVVFLRGSEFFNWAYAGMVDAAAAIGPHVRVELQGPAEWDASLQARAIDQLVARNVAGILATAGDAETMIPSIDRAISRGIPVITFDSDAPDSDRLAFVGTNNYQAGFRAGLAAAEWLGNDARVGVSLFPGPTHIRARVDGFRDALLQAAPGAQIVAEVNDEGSVSQAETAITAMLQANPQINVIFASHGNPGPGAAAAVRNLGLQGRVDIIAFDFGAPVLELIQSGEIRATVGQNPYLMGYMGLMIAYSARRPTEVPLFGSFGPHPGGIDTGVQILYIDGIEPFLNPPSF